MSKSLLQEAARRYGAGKLAEIVSTLSPDAQAQIPYTWRLHARPDQLPPPGDWRVWLLMAGRGAGKTRSAAEFVRDEVEAGRAHHIGLVGETATDVRDTMIELGPSSLLKISRPDFMPRYEPSKRRLVWPNGATATHFSSEKPDQLRGPQFDLVWADELAAWEHQRATWDNLEFGLRLTGPKGDRPRCVVSTTPRPNDVVLELARGILLPDRTRRPRTDVVVGARASTYDNAANLDPGFLRSILARYEGTRVGRQELHADILEDVQGALWTQAMIDAARVPADLDLDLKVVVIGVDPAVSTNKKSNETGIVAAGLGADGDVYVLADRSGRLGPGAWAARAIGLYDELEADRIVPEVNNGGDLVTHTIRMARPKDAPPVRPVHATRGKRTRAEPIAVLYEQGRVHHVGALPVLEDQLCTWVPGADSPDRLDALVWAITSVTYTRARGPRVAAPRTVEIQ